MRQMKHNRERELLYQRMAVSTKLFKPDASFRNGPRCPVWTHTPFIHQNP
jgi:hypothetical protein